MTNRHVAEVFTLGLGSSAKLRFAAAVTPSVNLWAERGRAGALVMDIVEPVMIHPYWDLALLRVHSNGLVPSLALASTGPSKLLQHPVAVVGYPFFDPRGSAALQRQIFGDVFGVKRLQPGYGIGQEAVGSYGKAVPSFAHDCSTLGGNSGSCVLDVRSGLVLGLHFAGAELVANYAVPAWELARDPRIVDAGVNFEPAPGLPRKPAPPEVSSAWSMTEQPAARTGPGAASPVDWYERTGPAEMQEQWREDPAGVAERLERAIGRSDARAARLRLAEGRTERLFRREPDRSALEVLYLHGILGAHLDSADGRAWFSIQRTLFGNVADALELQSDGRTDAWRGQPIGPGPHLRIKYQRAADAWRDEGLVVHEFSYDWRKRITEESERFHAFVSTLRIGRPGRRFLVVAHSMGGLIASTWASRHPDFAEVVERAVFLGSPLRGSFAPFEAICGTYPLFRKIDAISLPMCASDLVRAARSLPGLVDMLPDPEVFPTAAGLYHVAGWDVTAPAQEMLDASRRLKDVLRESPLLARAVALVSRVHPTTGNLPDAVQGHRRTAGDGTVPLRSAATKGLAKVYLVRHEHSDLPRDPLAIAAVLRLARGEPLGLEAISPIDPACPEEPIQGADDLTKEVAAYDDVRAGELRARPDRCALDGADVDWLLSTGSGPSGRDGEGVPYVVSSRGAPPPSAGPGGQEGPTFREFQVAGPFGFGDPVHETITTVALDRAGKDVGDRTQILRGVFWNDDPEGLLFTDNPKDWLELSTGLMFGLRFKRFERASRTRGVVAGDGLLARSHFGDLQFLHAMAATAGTSRDAARDAILDWAEFCWAVLCGQIEPGAQQRSWGPMQALFADVDGPSTVQALFRAQYPEHTAPRALGSLLHLIEDSWSFGHVDRANGAKPGRFGGVRRYYCYTDQAHAWHASFDCFRDGGTPEERIERLPGGPDALDTAVRLINLRAGGKEWGPVRAWLIEQVLAPTEGG